MALKPRTVKSGLGFGMGETGGYARIEYALDQIRIICEKNDYDDVIFDVLGFGRAAALARYFINLVNQWPAHYNCYDHSDPVPENDLYTIPAFPQHITGRVAFAGLLDTVGSFYIAAHHNEGEINLNLHEHSAERVVHFVAADEIRHNFPSTRISTESGYLPSNFTEILYPGVHADIGGGYENPTPGAATSFDDWRDFYHVVEVYEAGWDSIRVQQLQQRIERRGHTVMMKGTDVYELTPIDKELSIYPLRQMYDLAFRFILLISPTHVIMSPQIWPGCTATGKTRVPILTGPRSTLRIIFILLSAVFLTL